MSFRDRYRRALVFKDPAVEEPIDMAWHRPLAALFVASILELPLTPTQVTMMSLVVGWLATGALALAMASGDGASALYALAGALLCVSVILDCADGQLARAKGGGTRLGRVLDGCVDFLVVLPFYILLGIDLQRRFGALGFYLALFAGVTGWVQILVYDRTKGLYLTGTTFRRSGADGDESLEQVLAERARARESGKLLARFSYWIYVDVQMRFQRLFAGPPKPPSEATPSVDGCRRYAERHRGTMRLASWMGLGIHMVLLYVPIALLPWLPSATFIGQAVIAVAGNGLLAVTLVRGRAM